MRKNNENAGWANVRRAALIGAAVILTVAAAIAEYDLEAAKADCPPGPTQDECIRSVLNR